MKKVSNISVGSYCRAWLRVAIFTVAACGGTASKDPGDAGIDSSIPDSGIAPSVEFQHVTLKKLVGDELIEQEYPALTVIRFLPDDHGLLLGSKEGAVYHYKLQADGSARYSGEFSLQDVHSSSECGLISMAIDPEWEANHYIYVGHCTSIQYSRVARITFDGTNYASVAASAVEIINVGDDQATKAWHAVGAMGFFPDQYNSMWVLFGEKNLRDNAQDVSNNMGAALRIIPERGASQGGYAPHPENVFNAGQLDEDAGMPEDAGPGSDASITTESPDIYAYGFRSPWQGHLDSFGRLWIGDVGSTRFEEINVVSVNGGENFGWPVSEGPCELGASGCAPFTEPEVHWDRSSNHPYRLDDGQSQPTSRRLAWVGLYYEPGDLDKYGGRLNRRLIFGDMCVGFVRALVLDSQGLVTSNEHLGHFYGTSSWAQGPDGYVYTTSFGSCSNGLPKNDDPGVGLFRMLPKQ